MGMVFSEITVIICLAAALSVVCRIFKQPAILAYILTGVIVGPLGLLKLHNQELLQVLSEFGITLLLFMLGLEIRIKDFLSIGKMSLIIGVAQIVFSIAIFFSGSIFPKFFPRRANLSGRSSYTVKLDASLDFSAFVTACLFCGSCVPISSLISVVNIKYLTTKTHKSK